ncbi:DUF3810 family protein [Gynuella sp.]|uniref:DUF3810 family protein n=1 Tax=Gynuella sp. TaxID=2969146 RepID=UPI003D1444C5
MVQNPFRASLGVLLTVVCLGICLICLLYLPAYLPAWFMDTYSRRVYPFWQYVWGELHPNSRWLLADFLWPTTALLFLVRLIWLGFRYVWWFWPFRAVLEVLLWAGVLTLLFMVSWGLNYHKPSLYHQYVSELDSTKLSPVDWIFAIQQSRAARPAEISDTCKDKLSYSLVAFQPETVVNQWLGNKGLPEAPDIAVKTSLWSPVYTRLSIAGMFTPITGEATISNSIFVMVQPFTKAHEFAHWAGYAFEQDADLIAYMALWQAEDPWIVYAGWLQWWHSIGAPEEYRILLGKEVNQDLDCYSRWQANKPRWRFQHLFWQAYDKQLKAQGIVEGIASYRLGEAVALKALRAAR